jgi:hypothetical protein
MPLTGITKVYLDVADPLQNSQLTPILLFYRKVLHILLLRFILFQYPLVIHPSVFSELFQRRVRE